MIRPTSAVARGRSDCGPDLGPLTSLNGAWSGEGFNLLARPGDQNGKPFVLDLTATDETLQFSRLGPANPSAEAPAPAGLHHRRRASDAVTHGPLETEPAIWIDLPVAGDPATRPAHPPQPDASPDGSWLGARGTRFTVAGAPRIETVSALPLEPATQAPIIDAQYLEAYADAAPPPGIPATAIANPNLLLSDRIDRQTILRTTVMAISLSPRPGIGGVRFVIAGADLRSLEATFWLEEIEHPDGYGTFLQLQYTQTAILRFLDIDWPRISVATLTKAW